MISVTVIRYPAYRPRPHSTVSATATAVDKTKIMLRRCITRRSMASTEELGGPTMAQ